MDSERPVRNDVSGMGAFEGMYDGEEEETEEMTSEDLETILYDALRDVTGDECTGIETFEQAGILTNNRGLERPSRRPRVPSNHR